MATAPSSTSAGSPSLTPPGLTAGPIAIRTLTGADVESVAELEALVFGPGRFARTAYRLREGRPPLSPFCHGAFAGDALIASVRLTPVRLDGHGDHLLLGPLSVHPDHVGQGHGRALVAAALESAKHACIASVILVGDQPYYARFGFNPAPPGSIGFPGPVNPARILVAVLDAANPTPPTGALTATP
jgi:predicted N-acetyltransferase YhbS